MGAIADEIVAADPHAVGLQEVTRWTTYDYNPSNGTTSNATVAYDFLDLLLAELAERGVTYREVPGATATNFTSPPIPILAGAPYPTRAVSLQDRDVIIVRDGVKATNAQSGNFEAILGPPDFPLPADRGWGSADLRTRLATFRFVNSHTEAFSPEFLRVLEVRELLEEQERITEESGALPTVYAGDYNSPGSLRRCVPDAPRRRAATRPVERGQPRRHGRRGRDLLPGRRPAQRGLRPRHPDRPAGRHRTASVRSPPSGSGTSRSPCPMASSGPPTTPASSPTW